MEVIFFSLILLIFLIVLMTTKQSVLKINHYSLVSKIGEGGFSKVYRVRDLQANEYAAKVANFNIDDETKDSEKALLLFREVNLMSMLNHPAVLKFVGYFPTNFEGDPSPTIITELSTNGSLYDIIKMQISGLAPKKLG